MRKRLYRVLSMLVQTEGKQWMRLESAVVAKTHLGL